MAKKSKIARKTSSARLSSSGTAAKRLELKKALVDPNGTDESREAARKGLQKLPRNASPVRVRFARRDRRSPPRCAHQVRHFARALPRHGSPW